MKRDTPLLPYLTLAWLSAAWIAGIACAALYGRGAWPIVLAVAGALIALAAVRRQRVLLLFALALPLLFAGAVLRYDHSVPHPPADAASRFNGGPSMRIRGVLRDDPNVGDTSQQFAITVREVQVEGDWQQATGGVLVRTGTVPARESGDLVELEGKLETPENHDGFDYAEYLARRGISSVMQYPSAKNVGHEDDSLLRATTLSVRRRLSTALALALPEPQASLAQGVLLGQRSALPHDVQDDLNNTNTSHLVVVSGENVVLVSTYVTIVLAWIVGRRRALALSIAAVLAYAMLVGASPPVMRAVIMGVLLIVARLAGRPSSGLTSILFAVAVMAGIDPPVVRDVSFQLSFAATAGIVYLASPFRAQVIDVLAWLLRRDEVPRLLAHALAEPLAVTLAAILATSPLLALNFGRLSLVAIPANVLIVPAFPFILLASLIAALGGMLPGYRLVFAAPAYYALSYWLTLARWFASWPHSAAELAGYNTRWAAATYALIAAAAFALLRFARPPYARVAASRPMNFRRLRGIAAVAVPAVALLTSAGFVLWPAPPRRLEVTVLDVGQGDAILIETPSGQHILVDGGPGRSVLRGLGEQMSWHDRSIDLVILTHPQADHVTGLLDVLARDRVGRVIAGPGVLPSSTSKAWLNAVHDEGLDIETATEGMTIDLGDGAMLKVLGPDDVEARDGQINNTSAVVRVSWHDVSFLLTADIEAQAERALLSDGVDLHSTVLKVPHHGSTTSSTQAFLDAVQPDVAVISAGRDNAFGLPAPEVVERLQQQAAVYNTADSGTVHFATDGRRLWVTSGR